MQDFEKYKSLPKQIEAFYNKQHNIDNNIKETCMQRYNDIKILMPRIQVLLDALNACIKYDYREVLKETNNIKFSYNRYNNYVHYLIYGDDNNLHFTINGDLMILYDKRISKKSDKYITDFKDLLKTFIDDYNEFEKQLYKSIYDLINI